MKKLFIAIVVLGVIAAGGWAAMKYSDRTDKSAGNYRFAQARRSDVLATIGATGTIEPDEVVDVGAQVAGQIFDFGKDANGNQIDYGSPVDEKMVLAHIDDQLYQADLASAKAQIESANAGVLRAEADLTQSKANLFKAERDWNRAQQLSGSEALAQTTYDNYKATYDVAQANVGISEAALAQAKSTVTQATAAKVRVDRNIEYCTIRSPVKGVIIDRRVNVGQTVVSSLNAPSLFLIAKDLKRMELWVAVNEADIGQVHAGQPVTFTVDAYPGQQFHGEVQKVRLNAVMTQNVVTYTVEVATDNPDGKLLPYLTANVQFQTGYHEDVVVVPNAALRWTPRPEAMPPADTSAAGSESGGGNRAAGGRGEGRGGRRGGGNGGNGGNGATTRRAAQVEDTTRGTVYVQDGQYVRPIQVRLGLVDTDKGVTEVLSDNVQEGMNIIVGETRADTSAAAGPVSPFMPQFNGRGGGGGGGRRGGF